MIRMAEILAHDVFILAKAYYSKIIALNRSSGPLLIQCLNLSSPYLNQGKLHFLTIIPGIHREVCAFYKEGALPQAT